MTKHNSCIDCGKDIHKTSKRCRSCNSINHLKNHKNPFYGKEHSEDTLKKLRSTWEERYGKEKADMIKFKIMGDKNVSKRKDVREKIVKGLKEYYKTHDGFMKGKIVSEVTKEKQRRKIKGRPSQLKGKTYEQIYGKEKAEQLKKKSSNLRKEYYKTHDGPGKGKKRPIEDINKIKKRLKEYYKINDSINKGRKFPQRNGEGNANWKGGLSFKPYDKKFNNSFKEEIRKRDNNQCMLCEKNNEEQGKNLSIHHIDYDKKNSTKENCVSLCHQCHLVTNQNRKYWTKFLQDLLSKVYGYEYNL